MKSILLSIVDVSAGFELEGRGEGELLLVQVVEGPLLLPRLPKLVLIKQGLQLPLFYNATCWNVRSSLDILKFRSPNQNT